MDTLINVFVVLHFIGFIVLLADMAVQLPAAMAGKARMRPAMRLGAAAALLTGIVLVALNQADDQDLNNVKLAVKLGVVVIILALIYVKRDEEKVPNSLFGAVAALTVGNILVAALW
ncbi:hypothetical protein [Streptomyces sp. NBC_01803]|uniref:hypothetical protein n=1 Tax=Streptomyces sp. NBC_01803 TaxID=2975946 RepID=UPI002DD99ADC|nr:hypothetical protein [Streptomyces sp. NBC_01803]WSA45852.1 hypothetical protein OIE51_17560 [Streptomyces sp. NBC_01803]